MISLHTYLLNLASLKIVDSCMLSRIQISDQSDSLWVSEKVSMSQKKISLKVSSMINSSFISPSKLCSIIIMLSIPNVCIIDHCCCSVVLIKVTAVLARYQYVWYLGFPVRINYRPVCVVFICWLLVGVCGETGSCSWRARVVHTAFHHVACCRL